MRRRIATLFIAISMLHGFNAHTQQSSPPTLEATTKFIADKTNTVVRNYRYDDVFPDGSRGNYKSTLSETITINGCQGHLVIHEHSEKWNRTELRWEENQDSDLDNTSFQAKFLLPSSSKLSRWDERWKDQQTSTPTVYVLFIPGYVDFILTDPDLAPRIQKAVAGWSRLCGAKDEPY